MRERSEQRDGGGGKKIELVSLGVGLGLNWAAKVKVVYALGKD